MVQASSTDGWAFLIARGLHMGYRSVLAPDFLVSTGTYGTLAEAVDGNHPDSHTPRFATVDIPGVGIVTLAYRTEAVVHADLRHEDPSDTGSMVDCTGDGFVLDEHGRPLHLLYGFACRTDGLTGPDEQDLLEARRQAFDAYRHFLADEDAFTVKASKPFRTRTGPSSPMEQNQGLKAQATPVPPPRPGSHTRPVGTGDVPQRANTMRLVLNVVILVLVAAVAAVMLWAVLTPPDDCPEGQVRADTVDEEDCPEPPPD